MAILNLNGYIHSESAFKAIGSRPVTSQKSKTGIPFKPNRAEETVLCNEIDVIFLTHFDANMNNIDNKFSIY